MEKIDKVQKDTTAAIGFWSSIAATLCSVIFLIALIMTFLRSTETSFNRIGDNIKK
jgi:hypothetical protein